MVSYLKGVNIRPHSNKEAKNLIGKVVEYLCKRDIDKSSRGYYFSRINTIEAVSGRQIIFENSDSISLGDIVEMVVKEPVTAEIIE